MKSLVKPVIFAGSDTWPFLPANFRHDRASIAINRNDSNRTGNNCLTIYFVAVAGEIDLAKNSSDIDNRCERDFAANRGKLDLNGPVLGI